MHYINNLNMMNFKQLIPFLILFFLSINSTAQVTASLPKDAIMAVKESDAESLAASFNDNIEIILPQSTAVYSRKQAEMVLKDFFVKNPVTEFELIHQGKKESASFAIANYHSSNGQYRFTFLTKTKGSKIYIHQIRIEKQ